MEGKAKFYRLKNAKIIKFEDIMEYYHMNLLAFLMTYKDEIVKEADTIHELVDAYWLENVHYSDPMYEPTYSHACHVLEDWLKSDIELNTDCLKDITMYGSIYVKGQGWRHVSKLSIDKLGKITEVLL